MADSSLQHRSGGRYRGPRNESEAFHLQAVAVAATNRQDAINDALRLLAAWAVRGARARETGDETDAKGARR